jgi:hypothetical protein
VSALREIIAKFGFDVDSTKLTLAVKDVDAFATKLKTLAEKLAGGDITTGIKDMVSDLKDQTAEIKSLSRLTGQTFAETQRWASAAKLSGSNIQALATGFRVLQKNAAAAAGGVDEAAGGIVDAGDGMIEAALGSKASREAFKALGVDVKDASGQIKSSSQLMGDAGLAIAALKSPAERSAFAMKIFGRSGTALLPMFAQGEKGLQGFLDTIDQLGGGISDEAVKAMAENSRASKEYDMAILSLKSSLVTVLLPAMTAKVQILSRIVGWCVKAAQGTELIRSGVMILAVAMLWLKRAAIDAGIKSALAWLPTIALFAVLILLVDDITTAFKGGDSAIGRLLDKIGGAGTSAAVLGKMGKDAEDLGKKLDILPTIGAKVEEGFSVVGASIVRFFVDDIPEAWGFLTKDLHPLDFLSKLNDSFTQGLLDVIHGIIKWTKDAATAITDGISDGLRDGWVKVKATFTELFTSLKDDFKKFFKINSPSKLYYELTGFLPDGMIGALADAAPAVRSQANDTWAQAMPGQGQFAPNIKVQTVAPAGGRQGPSSRTANVDAKYTIQVVGGAGGGVSGAVREGIGQANGDGNRAMLAALESEPEG